jgi:hypothetical protein
MTDRRIFIAALGAVFAARPLLAAQAPEISVYLEPT